MNVSKPYTFDRVIRIIIGLSIVVILFFLLQRLSAVLLPFFIAWLIAYLLQPFVSFFQYKLKFKNRILSVVSTLVLFAGLLTALVLLLAPIVSVEIQKLADIISQYANGLSVSTFIPIAWQNEIQNYLAQLDIRSVLKDENIMAAIKNVAPQLWDILNSSLNIVFGFTVMLIVFLYLVFILIDFENVTSGMFEMIPDKYRSISSEIIHDLEIGMNRYFRGQALLALIVAILFSIGFSIIGLPLAIVFGLFVGVLNLVPYLKTIAIIPALFLALLQSAQTGERFMYIMLGLFVIFVIVQLIEDLILVPKIMGHVTGLNPAIILLSLSIWGSLMGIIGLIIALPMTTLIISYYKRFVLQGVADEQVVPKSVDQNDVVEM